MLDPSMFMGGGGEEAPPQPQQKSPVSILKELIQQTMEYMGVEKDEEQKAVAATCLQNFQKLLAQNQKEEDSAMGVTPAHRVLRRQSGYAS